MKIRIINKSPHKLPKYETENSAGMDIKAFINNNITLKPLDRTIVATGLYLSLPKGLEAQVRPRSGLAIKKGITVIKLSKIIIIRIRSILYLFDRLLPFVSLAKLINKTYEIDSNRVFLSSDSLTAKRFDSDKSREDFIEYLK